jgi:type II secretory pathway component GspD/PulD (secretin)
LKIKEAFVPYSSSVVYPDNWDVVSNRQSQELGLKEDPAWKRKLDELLDKHLSYRCPGLPLTAVLSQLSELSGLNIVLSPRVLQERDEAELELSEFNYGHMKLRHILQWVCREVDLAFILKYDVIYITNKNSAMEKTKIRIYDVQDLLSSKQNYLAPSLNDGFLGAEGGLDIAAEDIEQEDPISGDIIVEMIQKSIAGNWEDGEGVLIRPLETGAIVIKNTNDVHQQVVDLLNTLRKTSALQIEVEARSLSITKGFFRELGFDWTGLNSVAPLDVGAAAGFVDNRNESFDIKGAIVNGLTSEIPGIGFFLEHSILGSFQAKVLLKALEQDQDTTELIAPKLVLVNNILGYIRLGRTQNYISGYELGGGDEGSVGLQPIITSVDEGQLLAVTATVSSDRRYITLRLHPDFQEVSIPRVATVQGTQTTAGPAGPSVTSYNLPVDLPYVVKKQVRTTAVIPDDGVLILGGVSSSTEDKRVRGVPLLSKIPILGRLFRSDHKSDSSSDEMLLVHGKIIVFDELEADL